MRFCTFFIALALLLGGCGIKPGSVDAPSSVKKDTFPQTYPHPDTDPAP